MTLSLSGVLNAVKQVGAATPAFKALFDQVVGTFGEQDQATLKGAYAEARARSDRAHDDLQSAARGE